jgi:hypothetical protein
VFEIVFNVRSGKTVLWIIKWFSFTRSYLASSWRFASYFARSRSAFWNLHSDSRSRYSHLSTSIPESYSPSSECYCKLCIFCPYSTFYFLLSIFMNCYIMIREKVILQPLPTTRRLLSFSSRRHRRCSYSSHVIEDRGIIPNLISLNASFLFLPEDIVVVLIPHTSLKIGVLFQIW